MNVFKVATVCSIGTLISKFSSCDSSPAPRLILGPQHISKTKAARLMLSYHCGSIELEIVGVGVDLRGITPIDSTSICLQREESGPTEHLESHFTGLQTPREQGGMIFNPCPRPGRSQTDGPFIFYERGGPKHSRKALQSQSTSASFSSLFRR
jgi:hypothetical protein